MDLARVEDYQNEYLRPKPKPRRESVDARALRLAVEGLLVNCEDCPLVNDGCVGIPHGVDDVLETEQCPVAVAEHYRKMAKTRRLNNETL